MRFNVGQEVELHRECAKAAQGLAVSRKKPSNNVVNYAVSNFMTQVVQTESFSKWDVFQQSCISAL